jgi:hypothetical protein
LTADKAPVHHTAVSKSSPPDETEPQVVHHLGFRMPEIMFARYCLLDSSHGTIHKATSLYLAHIVSLTHGVFPMSNAG